MALFALKNIFPFFFLFSKREGNEGGPWSFFFCVVGRCVWPRHIEQRAARDGAQAANPRSSGRQCSVWRWGFFFFFFFFFPSFFTYSSSSTLLALELWMCFLYIDIYAVYILSLNVYGLSSIAGPERSHICDPSLSLSTKYPWIYLMMAKRRENYL